MKRHLNTLFVTLDGAYLRKDGEALEIRHEGVTKMRVPFLNLQGICVFGWDTHISAALMHACTEAGLSLSFHSPHGKFLASIQGPQSGNILLRRAQYRAADNHASSLHLASRFVAAKLANSRSLLLRAARELASKSSSNAYELQKAADAISHRARHAIQASDLDTLRGWEGEAATAYFAMFPLLFTNPATALPFTSRSRRPPLDPANALLSFLYTLLAHDVRSAIESIGLDPQCGFLHRDRPGRPSLALDLMEELRPVLADRALFTLVNRGQITPKDFQILENGAVLLRDDARKTILTHWQERKNETFLHPVIQEEITIGLLPFIQTRLLARFLRGDIDDYPAHLMR